MIGDTWGVRRPFEVAFCFFFVSALYARFSVPYVSPESMTDGTRPAAGGIAGFFAPLKVLYPQRLRLSSGRVRKHFGVFFLCMGVFTGVLATDYAPSLIQIYATAVFRFTQADNGWLMSGFAFMRAVFLIFIFPRIISNGRKWYVVRKQRSACGSGSSSMTGSSAESTLAEEEDGAAAPELPTNPQQLEAPTVGVGEFSGEEEPLVGSSAPDKDEDTTFDLFFLRWSLVVDGALTMCAAFATQKWHIYLGTLSRVPLASLLSSPKLARRPRDNGDIMMKLTTSLVPTAKRPSCCPLRRERRRRPRV